MVLTFEDEESIRAALDDLRRHDSPLNWVLFGYKTKESLEMLNAGDGGLDELVENFKDDEIRFAILEAVVTGDSYNAVKFVLITWIGDDVPPGIAKARAAGHRKELVDLVTASVAIAAEVQPSSRAQLNSKDISQRLTKMAASYQDSVTVGEAKEKRQELSRAVVDESNRVQLSQLTLVGEEAITESLKSVYKGENEWCIIQYVEGSRDEVTLKAAGSGGTQGLAAHLKDDEVSFCVLTLVVKETTAEVTKYVLICWVGNDVAPLKKARSGPHRKELADWIIKIVPFHSHYQANTQDDMTRESILCKLRW